MQKNSQIILLDSNPKLPGKRLNPPDNSGESNKFKPLKAFLGWWKRLLWRQRKGSAEPTGNERVEIEARVSNHLYPKRPKK
jgi:hypothetical protein